MKISCDVTPLHQVIYCKMVRARPTCMYITQHIIRSSLMLLPVRIQASVFPETSSVSKMPEETTVEGGMTTDDQSLGLIFCFRREQRMEQQSLLKQKARWSFVPSYEGRDCRGMVERKICPGSDDQEQSAGTRPRGTTPDKMDVWKNRGQLGRPASGRIFVSKMQENHKNLTRRSSAFAALNHNQPEKLVLD